MQRVTLHCFAGPESDWEEQRAELIEGLLSSNSPSQLAMQEAVGVLLYMAQDDTSSSGGDSPQVIPFTISSLLPSLLCLLAYNCMVFVASMEVSRWLVPDISTACESRQAVLISGLHNGQLSTLNLCNTCNQASHPSHLHFDCSVMAQHGLALSVVCKLFDSACSALMWMITRAYQHQGAGCDGAQGRLSQVYAASI